MSVWHGDFSQRFSNARPLAARKYIEIQGDGFDSRSWSKVDRCHLDLLTLSFAVTDKDADYLCRLSKFDYDGPNGYLRHIYWIYLSDAFRGLRQLSNGRYRCEICNKEVIQTEVHHWSYDNCGREYVHLEDLGLLCKRCHVNWHRTHPQPPKCDR